MESGVSKARRLPRRRPASSDAPQPLARGEAGRRLNSETPRARPQIPPDLTGDLRWLLRARLRLGARPVSSVDLASVHGAPAWLHPKR